MSNYIVWEKLWPGDDQAFAEGDHGIALLTRHTGISLTLYSQNSV